MVPKYTSFAFNYADGGKEENTLNEYQKRKKIIELPSFL